MRKRSIDAKAKPHRSPPRNIVNEQRDATATLRSEQELSDFFDNAVIALHWVGPDGAILRANRAELELLGYSREEYVGHHIADFHVDPAVIEEILKRLTMGETLRNVPAALRCKDGSIKDVLIDSNVYRKDGQFIHTRCFTRDVTNLRRAENEMAGALLREQVARARAETTERRMAVLADITRSITSPLELDTVLQRLVDGARELGGSDTAAIFLRAEDSDDMVPRYRVGAWPEAYKSLRITPGHGVGGNVMLTGRPARTEDYLKDLRVPVDFHAMARAMGTVALMVVPIVIANRVEGLLYISNRAPRPFTSEDEAICLRLADQAAIAIQNAQLLAREKAARRDAEVALAMLDRVQMVMEPALSARSVDDLLRDLLQRVRKALHGDTATVLLLDQHAAALVPVASDGLREELHESIRVPLGHGVAGRIAVAAEGLVIDDLSTVEVVSPFLRERISSLVGAPLRIDERLVGVIHVGTLTPRRFMPDDRKLLRLVADRLALAIERARLDEAERAARAEAEAANRAKDEFLAMLSHELRTPLTSVLGWARMLRVADLKEERVAVGLESIERNARLLARLIEDLLDVSRIVTGKMELDRRPLDLLLVVEAAIEAVRPAAEAKGLALHTHLNPAAGQVMGDAARLQQVVWNLVTNAVKFTPSEGNIALTLDRVADDAELVVRDTGQGIDAEMLPHIFDRFRQADSSRRRAHGGLGLGLAIVRQLVELHGGTIKAESAGEGKGATFRVRLPILRDELRPLLRVPAVASRAEITSEWFPSLEAVRVLVVDDEPDACELLTTILTKCGADVAAAHSVSQALDAVLRVKPDVVLADLGMPGQDGYDLIRRLRALGPGLGRIPAIAITAYASVEDRKQAISAGFEMHLAKPVEPAELAQAVGKIAGRREPI